ncbi:hypothetical protein D9M68_197300 [compost metagenome]
MNEQHNIAAGFVQDALESLHSKGIDAAPLLAQAGLPLVLTGPVTNQQYGRLWWLISKAIDDEFFGLAARPMRPGSFNLLCHAVLNAGTLERALRRALLFLNVVLDDPRGELRIRNGEALIVLRDQGDPRPAFAYRAYWLILMGVLSWLVGRRIPLRRLDFACRAPEHRVDYRQFFGAPVSFDCPETSLVFSASYLSMSLIRNEQALEKFLRAAPANILIRYRHDDGIAMKIRTSLNTLQPLEWPSFEDTAALFGLSPATLRRQLRSEGQSFSAIRDELRADLAQKLLSRSGLTVTEVAIQLGYSEPSAFHRAFIKWSGVSPGAYRKMRRTR